MQIFVAIACMAKATVQAALGPVTLKRITSSNTDEEKKCAELILMVCILSIVVTAPLGGNNSYYFFPSNIDCFSN